MPDNGGEGEDALQDAYPDAGGGAPAVAFEAELALRVWKVDSMIWRSGSRDRWVLWAGSVLVPGRMRVMPTSASWHSKAALR